MSTSLKPDRYFAAAVRFHDRTVAVRFYCNKHASTAKRTAENAKGVQKVEMLREITKSQYERATARRKHDCSRRCHAA